ncbi:hypothetical protein KQI08_02060 [Paraeggerthella hongkongensis]|uniref:hypothetical protein n=1 Tax=Paraeggerthella hominis TaxID=2897351 RepID=UPI001C106B12|nr:MULTISPECIES: hypothetical protein [Paraeggerthella]MBU5404704.1 hypothetical protein [Paraeggerthella hongkongensis]MCD2432398.1 hypothetical protein [Paraeggerthella hominis]
MVDRSADVGPWLIVVDAMDYDRADELGRTMGSLGVTGKFMRGEVADCMADAARWRKHRKEQEIVEHQD